MSQGVRNGRSPGLFHAWAAVVFFVAVPASLLYSNYLAEDAVVRYGRNVDSGASLSLFAIYFMAPAAATFASAAVALHLRWRVGSALHWLAMAWLALPVLLLLLAEVRRYIGA